MNRKIKPVSKWTGLNININGIFIKLVRREIKDVQNDLTYTKTNLMDFKNELNDLINICNLKQKK